MEVKTNEELAESAAKEYAMTGTMINRKDFMRVVLSALQTATEPLKEMIRDLEKINKAYDLSLAMTQQDAIKERGELRAKLEKTAAEKAIYDTKSKIITLDHPVLKEMEEALNSVLSSAVPHYADNSAMHRAWNTGKKALASLAKLKEEKPVINPMESLLEYEKNGGKILFWTCPNDCDAGAEWNQSVSPPVARCTECGETN